MSRVKTFDATGIAPNGVLYAGDLNAIQDQYADLVNLTQNHSVGTLTVGESGLTFSRFGPAEVSLVGAFRSSGIVRGLGGVYPGQFTTTTRDAITAGFRPTGLIVYNTTTGRFEWNSGTDAAPNWRPIVADTTGGLTLPGNLTFNGNTSSLAFNNQSNVANIVWQQFLSGDTQPRFTIRADGTQIWGAGGVTSPDTTLSRISPGQLAVGSSTQAGSVYTFASSGTSVAYRVRIGADANSTYAVWGNGIISFGLGGASAQDIEIARTGAAGSGGLRIEIFSGGGGGTTIAPLQADLKTGVASVTTARTGGAAAALPANPVRYLAMQDENGNRVYVPCYS